jgi:hypothetical protein
LPPGTGTPPDPAPADARPPDARPPDARPADARPADARPPDVRPADAVPPAQAPAADVAALPPPLPWPEEAIGPPPPPVATGPDPVLLRARPVRRPPPREQVWVLTLPKPVCVRADPDDLINTSERNIRKLQLVVDGSLEQGFRQLAKRRVVVRGQLFHATTRRHYLPILVNVEDMRPPEMVEDTTKPPPLPPQP